MDIRKPAEELPTVAKDNPSDQYAKLTFHS